MHANEILATRIAEQAAHFDAATHRLLADIRAFDTAAGWRRSAGATAPYRPPPIRA